MTMFLIGTITVSTNGVNLINFTNIPQHFTDLMIFWSAKSTPHAGVDDWTNCNFNNNTSGPTIKQLLGDGSSTSVGGGPYFELGRMVGSGVTAGVFGNCMTYVANYAGSTHKAWSYDSVGENNATSAYQFIAAGVWANTAAITSIAFSPANGPSYAPGSTFSLYGIQKGSGGATVS